MSNLIPADTYIVVADGRSGRLFRNAGSGGTLALQEVRRLSPHDLAKEGPSGSRPEEQTPRQTDEATFAKQLGQALSAMLDDRECKHLILVLDPQTLGQVRKCMSKTTEASIVRTIAKDFTNSPIQDIERALSH